MSRMTTRRYEERDFTSEYSYKHDFRENKNIDIEVSKSIENYRLRLSRIITEDKKLWSYAARYVTENFKEGMSKKTFRELPRQIEYNGVGVTLFFANLEGNLPDILADRRDRKARDVKEVLDNIIDARNMLALAHMPFVKYCIKNFSYTKIKKSSFMDALEEGLLGLISAAQRYDYKTGYRFLTYSASYIVPYVEKAAKRDRLVRIPDRTFDIVKNVENRLNSLGNNREGNKSIDDIAKDLGMSVTKLREFQRISNVLNVSSLNYLVERKDSELELLGILADEKSLNFEDKLIGNDLIEAVKMHMNQRGGEILEMRVSGVDGDVNGTLQSIADKFSISRERVRQILEKEGRKAFLKVKNNKSRNNKKKIVSSK